MDNILMSDCAWCGEPYIKEKVGQMHGCAAERDLPAKLSAEAAKLEPTVADDWVIDLLRR
jgi:hypothetical protein